MFTEPQIISVEKQVNPIFEDYTNHCRYSKNRIEFVIEKREVGGKIEFTHLITFETVNTSEEVCSVKMLSESVFGLAKTKKEDDRDIEKLLSTIFLNMETWLKDNLPSQMILLSHSVSNDIDIKKLTHDVSLALTKMFA